MSGISLSGLATSDANAQEVYHRVTISPSGNKNSMDVNVVGSLLSEVNFDYIAATYPTSSSEVYTYKNGGSGGTTVATITVVYTDSTKETLSSVTKS